jgi:outer membrane lipoprotein-sorting protein
MRSGRRCKRLGLLLLGLALAVHAGAARAAGEEKGKGADTWFAETVQHGDSGIRVMNIWSKGSKLRAETTVAGTPLVTLVNGETYYNILPSAGTGVAIQRSPKAMAQQHPGGRPFGHDVERILARGAEKASSERLMGREVVVYRLSAGNTREEVWATDDAEKLPIKLVYTDREKGTTAETMLNWTRGVTVVDGFFEPDPRIAMEKLSYEEFVARVKDGKLKSFPPLFADLLGVK